MRRALTPLLTLVSTLGVLAIACSPSPTTQRGPDPGEPCTDCNVVLISLDTLRADHLGVYGYERETSPRIDAFARDAVVFDAAMAQAPWTLPSHMSMLTSLYTYQHGVHGQRDLHPDTLTLADVLHDGGWQTVAFTDGGWMKEKRGYHTFDLFESVNQKIGAFDKMMKWLAKVDDAKRPFFLFWQTYEPHCPYAPTDDFDRFAGDDYGGPVDVAVACKKHYTGALDALGPDDLAHIIGKYDGDIASTDAKVGRLLDRLDEQGLTSNTIVVVTSDHGESFGERTVDRMIGHGSMYEEVLRVPLLVRIPGGPGPGRVGHLVESIDIMPTVIEALGLPMPDGLSGRSLFDDANERMAYSERIHYPRLDPTHEAPGSEYVVARGTHRLIHKEKPARWELYDLATDPLQRTNLYGSGLEFEAAMQAVIAGHIRQREAGETARAGAPTVLDPENEAHLRALGYLE